MSVALKIYLGEIFNIRTFSLAKGKIFLFCFVFLLACIRQPFVIPTTKKRGNLDGEKFRFNVAVLHWWGK